MNEWNRSLRGRRKMCIFKITSPKEIFHLRRGQNFSIGKKQMELTSLQHILNNLADSNNDVRAKAESDFNAYIFSTPHLVLPSLLYFIKNAPDAAVSHRSPLLIPPSSGLSVVFWLEEWDCAR